MLTLQVHQKIYDSTNILHANGDLCIIYKRMLALSSSYVNVAIGLIKRLLEVSFHLSLLLVEVSELMQKQQQHQSSGSGKGLPSVGGMAK